jgi:hypothetical protein
MGDPVSTKSLSDLVTGGSGAPANPFDDAAASVMQSQAATIRNNVANAVGQNPAQVAQHSQMANALGVPIQSVQSDPATAQQRVAMQNFDSAKVVTQYPHLAQFLTDPTNAAKANNDLPTLAATEQAVKSLPVPADTQDFTQDGPQKPDGLLDDIGAGAKSTALKVFGAWDKAAVALSDALPDGSIAKMSPEERAYYSTRGAALQGPIARENAPQRWTGNVAGGLSYLPALVGGPPLLAAVTGGSEGSAASQNLKDAGVDPTTANEAGAATGAVMAAANFVPMGNVLFRSGAAPLAKTLVAAAVKSGAVGAGQEAITDTSTSALLKANGYGDLADQYAPTIDKAWQSALFMAGLHVGGQAVHAAMPSSPPADLIVNTAKAADATRSMEGLQALGELAAQSKLRENDPQAFHDFVQKVTDDGHLPEVWVDAKTLVDGLNQSGVKMDDLQAKLPDVAGQIHEALETGGDVKISTADYATHIAGTPLEQSILPHLKTDPQGMTFQEGQESLANQQADMTARAEQLVKDQPALDERQQQLKAITDDVHQQLADTGRFPADVSRQYAAMHGAVYDTMADRMGLSPAELRERMPLSITGESGSGYRQDSAPQTISDKTGAPQEVSIRRETFGANQTTPNSVMVSVRDPATGKRAGFVDFDVRADGVLTSANTHVLPEYRGRGLAESMYAAARRAGYDIAPGQVQTDKGLAMVESLQSKGIINRDAEGERFRAGNLELMFQGADQPRGSYDPAIGRLSLLKDADLSTFLHESGHHFLEMFHDLAQHAEAPEGVKGDFDTLLKSFGVKGDTPEDRMADWSGRTLDEKRAGHEQFAEGFEHYLQTGKAPVPELQSMFSRFRSWLMSVYGQLRGSVSPEVRSVMDRMFASQEAIREAERVRAYATPDLPGDDPALVDQYKTLGKDATEQAIADMQARSIRDMKWISNAKSKALKELQRSARDERAKISDEVTKEVDALPAFAAERAMKTAKPTSDIERDVIAEQHDYPSHEAWQADRAAHGDRKDLIEGLTDQRMLERHGDLTDPQSIERAAEAAIHNEARAKMMATGLKMFTKSPMSVLEINKAAKAAADVAVNAKAVGDLRPTQYSAAEARANRELLKLAPKDPAGAATAQREALLNNRLFKSSTEAVADVRKGLAYLKRFTRNSVREKVDVDIRDQIDDLLSRFDLRNNPSDAPTRAKLNLAQWRDSQVAAGMMPTVTDEMLEPTFRKPYRELTVEQFRGMVDTVRSLEETGKNRNTITINGEKADLDQYVRERMIPKLQEAGEKFKPDELYTRAEDRQLSTFQVGLDHAASWLRAVGAELKPQEFKRNFFDRHELMGPFGEAVFEPIMDANYSKVDMLRAMSDRFRAKADELGKDWQKSLTDPVDNKTLMDKIVSEQSGKPTPLLITRGRMLMLALHSGNESNFDKLTKGYGWSGADVWKFLGDNMGAKDIEAVNHIHALYESHWPDMLKLYREMGQTAPPKIEARETTLPNGKLTGGYAHIDYDPLRSRFGQKLGDSKAKEIAANGVSVGDYFKRTGTTNGAMNARVEGYTDAINLDFHTIEQALKETIHDLAYRRALVDVNKILEHPEFKQEFLKSYGRENLDAMHTWLGRVANSNNADVNASKLSKVLQYSRTGMVMNAIALRATTVAKHGGSAAIKTLGYFAGGGEKYLGSRMAAMTHDYSNQIEGAKDKFGEIRARLMQQDRDYRATASSLFEADPFRAKAERFGHAAVAWSDMMTAVPTAWAAYDRAVTEGIPVGQGGTGKPMTEAQAVAYANKLVREAHGSNIESARSNIMTEPGEGMKLFTTLYGFMNNTNGQMSDAVSKMRTAGISNSVVLARTFAAVIVPALWAGYLKGKDKADSWAEWVAKSIAGEVAGSYPFVRDAESMWEGMTHAGQVGVESWMQTEVQAVHDLYNAAQGKGAGKVVQDVANAAGEGLHIPGLGQLGKAAQYVKDVHDGKQHPKDALEYLKGLTIGAPKP